MRCAHIPLLAGVSVPAAIEPLKNMRISSRRGVFFGVAAGLTAVLAGRSTPVQAGAWVSAAATGRTPPQAFEPFLNQGFLVSGNGVNTSLTLVGIEPYGRGRRPGQFRDPFALLFRAWPGEVLTAGTYQVQDPAGHKTTMLLNQVTKDPSLYEAVFG